jgi:hypothetical protein
VSCNAGYSGGGTATCGTSGAFNTLTCEANSCTATQVSNSNFTATGSITGVTGQVSTSDVHEWLRLSDVVRKVEFVICMSRCLLVEDSLLRA